MSTIAKEKTDDTEGNPTAFVKPVIHPLLWRLLLIVGVFIYSSYTIFVHLCELKGRIPWKSSSMVLLTEITKFFLSVGMFIPELRKQGKLQLPNFWQILPFAVPAVLYCSNNNLAVYIQLEMDPATYQVLGNFKILTTAILFRLIIQKPITRIQWLALLLLLLAGMMNSYAGFVNNKGSYNAAVVHITITGLIMISIYCTVSGLSGVYTEYVYKNQIQMSIHLQNGFLYFFGILLNSGFFVVQAYKSNDYDLLTGFSVWTWALVVTQAIGGIIMGVIMKHASNITRLFLISTAMVLTTILSMIIFGLHLNVFFVISALMVILALYLYHR